MLQGTKTKLRAIRKGDLKFFLVWLNDPEVTQYLTVYLPMTDVAEEKYIEELSTKRSSTDVVFVIEAKSRKRWKPIGCCGIHRIDWKNRDAELGIFIGEKNFWSNGYGTEAFGMAVDYAFGQLGLNRVSAGAYAFNERSIKMQLRLGFKKEGVLRKAIFKNGEFHDKVMLGLLCGEWKKNKK
jgi:RimJ/RimL family protein N-acetyltransferase